MKDPESSARLYPWGRTPQDPPLLGPSAQERPRSSQSSLGAFGTIVVRGSYGGSGGSP